MSAADLRATTDLQASAQRVVLAQATMRVRAGVWHTPNGDPLRLRVDKVRTYSAFEAAPMLKWRGS